VLADIEEICLTSVHLLPLDEERPFQFRDAEARVFLAEIGGSGKRVIVDSGGLLPSWTGETLEYYGGKDQPFCDALLAQERKRLERLTRHYAVIDEVVRRLAIQTMLEMERYSNPHEHVTLALKPLQTYARIVIGSDVIIAASMAPPEPHPLRTTLAERIEAARASHSRGYSTGYGNPGFYAWAFGVTGGKDAIAKMGMRAPGFEPIRVLIPRNVFGDMEDAYVRHLVPFDPNGELFKGDFINYVLPQIAVAASYNLADPTSARGDLETHYAWRLVQYDRMGMD
jgi:hypothetical protein